MSMLSTFIYGYRKIVSAGVEAIMRDTIEFVGATVEDDKDNKRTKVTIAIPGLPTPTANHLLQGTGTEWAAVPGIDAARITSGGLPAARGGTGYSGYVVGDVLFASGPAALGTRAIGAEGSLFAVSGGLPNWVTGISTDKLTSGTLGVARGGTGLASYSNGDIIYAIGTGTLAKRAIGTEGQVLQSSSGIPSWKWMSRLYSYSGTNVVQVGGTSSPDTGQQIMLTDDGGYAVRMTNKTGAASSKGDVVEVYAGWVITGTQLSALSLKGAAMSNTDIGKVYLAVTVPGGNATVSVYKDSARTQLVAQGALVGAGNGGGTISLTEQNSSGLTGLITIVAAAVADATATAQKGITGAVRKLDSVYSPALPDRAAGVIYSDGVADGSDIWVVVGGKARIKTYAGASCGGYLLTRYDGTVDCTVDRDAEYATRGLGQSLERVTSGLVLAQLDLRGFGLASVA